MTTETDDLSYYEKELPAVIAGVRRGEKWELGSLSGCAWYQKEGLDELLYCLSAARRVRLAPVPVVKWWDCADDLPGPVVWIRGPQIKGECMITHTIGNTIYTAQGIGFNLERQGQSGYYQIEGHEYSTDLRNWSPCVKPEGGKL